MGIHSIIVIKNAQGKYLQYFDKRWNCYLFPNCKLPNNTFKLNEIEYKYEKHCNSKLELIATKKRHPKASFFTL